MNIGNQALPFTALRNNATLAARANSIKLLAEGDSWFAYPPQGLFSGPPNIISWLKRDEQLQIESSSSNGDEALSMLTGKQKFSLLERLHNERYDGILFSGGGNDLVGRYDFDFFLRDKRETGLGGVQLINEPRFQRRLTNVTNAYQDLIDLTADFGVNRGLPIITHTYDLVLPSDEGTDAYWFFNDVAGPWLKPYLDARNITDRDEQVVIIESMFKRFGDALVALGKKNPRLHVVETQGTLQAHHWRDEIHASSEGFKLIAEKLRSRVYQVFANRLGASTRPLALTQSMRSGSDATLEALTARIQVLELSFGQVGGQAPAFVRAASLGSNAMGDATGAPEISQHHDNWLSVRLKPDAPALGAARAMAAGAQFLSGARLGNLADDNFQFDSSPTDPFSAMAARGQISQVVPWRSGGRSNSGMLAVSADLRDSTSRVAFSQLVQLRDVTASEMKAELERDPQVARVQRVPVRHLIKPSLMAPNLSSSALNKTVKLWQFATMGWKKRMPVSTKVAVLDTGLDEDHPMFDANKISMLSDFGTFGSASRSDHAGHGTHVAGTICAKRNKANGHSGLIDCNLEMMKIFSDEPMLVSVPGGAAYSWVVDPGFFARALARCIEERFQVVNLSIGGGVPNDDEREAFSDLTEAGIAVVAAMGNDGSNVPSYPANYEQVIAVGASNFADNTAEFSNFGPHISLLAPGADILSTLPTYPGTSQWDAVAQGARWVRGQARLRDTHYAHWDGTSMATPHVSAAVALLIHKHPTEALAQIRARLLAAVVKIPTMAGQPFNRMTGYGRIDWTKL